MNKDCWRLVLSFLEGKNLAEASKVNKELRRLVLNHPFWKKKFLTSILTESEEKNLSIIHTLHDTYKESLTCPYHWYKLHLRETLAPNFWSQVPPSSFSLPILPDFYRLSITPNSLSTFPLYITGSRTLHKVSLHSQTPIGINLQRDFPLLYSNGVDNNNTNMNITLSDFISPLTSSSFTSSQLSSPLQVLGTENGNLIALNHEDNSSYALLQHYPSPINAMAQQKREQMALAFDNGNVALLDPIRQTLVCEAHTERAMSSICAFSDGRSFLCGNLDGGVFIFDARRGPRCVSVGSFAGRKISAMALIQETLVLSGLENGALVSWDLRARKERGETRCRGDKGDRREKDDRGEMKSRHRGMITKIQPSSNGWCLTSSLDSSLRFWDMKGGGVLEDIISHRAGVCDFFCEGDTLVSVDADANIQVRTRRAIKNLFYEEDQIPLVTDFDENKKTSKMNAHSKTVKLPEIAKFDAIIKKNEAQLQLKKKTFQSNNLMTSNMTQVRNKIRSFYRKDYERRQLLGLQ